MAKALQRDVTVLEPPTRDVATDAVKMAKELPDLLLRSEGQPPNILAHAISLRSGKKRKCRDSSSLPP